MITTYPRIRTLAFGAVVLVMLGFGVGSAAAQPGQLKAAGMCPFMRTMDTCIDCCTSEGKVPIWNNSNYECF